MTDPAPPIAPRPGERWVIALGAAGMFASVGIDFSVVVARFFHRSLAGSTEIIQYGVVAASCAALCVATIARAHAEVHLLTDRIAPVRRAHIARLGSTPLGLFLLVLAGGTAWLAIETIGDPERSDLLHLPILPLRFALLATCAALAILCGRRALASTRVRP